MTFDGANVYTGLLGTLGVRKESTYGTWNSGGTTRCLGIPRKTMLTRIANVVPLGGIRDSRVPFGQKQLGYHYEGSIELELQNALPLVMGMGVVSSTVAPAPYTHTITILRAATGGTASYLPSYTLCQIYQGSSDVNVEALGLTAKGLTVSCELGALAKATIPFIAKDLGSDSIDAPTEETNDSYGSYNTKLLVDNSHATYTSGTECKGLKKIELSMDNALEILGDFNQSTIRQPVPGSLKSGLKTRVERRYVDGDFLAMVGDTEFSMQLQFIRNAVSDYIYVTFNNCLIPSAGRTFDDAEPIANTPIDINVSGITATATDANSSYA